MGWGTLRAVRLSWTSADTHVAAATASGQLPAVWVVWTAVLSGRDDYGVGLNSLGWLFVLLLAPLWAPLAGLVQGVLLNRFAGAIAAFGMLRSARWAKSAKSAKSAEQAEQAESAGGRRPVWGWYLGATAFVSVLWAVLVNRCLGAPFVSTAVVLTALGVLPTLAVPAARRWARSWSAWGVWWRSVPVSAALFFVVLLGEFAAEAAGLVPEYEPPRLTAAQLAGAWRGADGAELRLWPGGRAEVTALPAERSDGSWSSGITRTYEVCDGTGTWFLDTDGRYDKFRGEGPQERDGAVVRLEGCGDDTYWVIGGTAGSPELFALFGDPDAGDVRILRPV